MKLAGLVEYEGSGFAGWAAQPGQRTVEGVLAEALQIVLREPVKMSVAGRTLWSEGEDVARAGYTRLFADQAIPVDAKDPASLVLFPEMDASLDVPEITVHCWDILGVHPESMMCASARMVVKRQGDAGPKVVPCTLLPYDEAFDMGETLGEAASAVKLNHPHCAKFCVLGGASCSAG